MGVLTVFKKSAKNKRGCSLLNTLVFETTTSGYAGISGNFQGSRYV